MSESTLLSVAQSLKIEPIEIQLMDLAGLWDLT